jgi:hypothetical protein
MEKIPTMFERDWEGDRSRVTPQPTPGCEWVFEGEGVATRQYDGTCMMFDGEHWWARREVKAGKLTPENFLPLSYDEQTGKTVGWEPVEQAPFVKFFNEALNQQPPTEWEPGTYELLGPKIQKNPEGYETHQLVGHAGAEQAVVFRSFAGIEIFLEEHDWEGIVFHHPDGRMAKIKARDFGLKRG